MTNACGLCDCLTAVGTRFCERCGEKVVQAAAVGICVFLAVAVVAVAWAVGR